MNDRLRALAELAAAPNPHCPYPTAGDWEAWFNMHGDPFVVERDRGRMGTVAQLSTAPADYGKARAEYIAAACPANVLALLDEVVRLRAALTATTAALTLWGDLKAAGSMTVVEAMPLAKAWVASEEALALAAAVSDTEAPRWAMPPRFTHPPDLEADDYADDGYTPDQHPIRRPRRVSDTEADK